MWKLIRGESYLVAENEDMNVLLEILEDIFEDEDAWGEEYTLQRVEDDNVVHTGLFDEFGREVPEDAVIL